MNALDSKGRRTQQGVNTNAGERSVRSFRMHLRFFIFIFQQTASILNALYPTIHCGHGIHYYCRSTFFELGVYRFLHGQSHVYFFKNVSDLI